MDMGIIVYCNFRGNLGYEKIFSQRNHHILILILSHEDA